MSGDRLQFDIIRLRKEGLTNAEIGDRLHITCHAVEQRVSKLITEGLLERRQSQRHQKISDDDIIKYRKEGLSNMEIADKLGVSVKSIEKRLTRLIGGGQVSKRAGGRNADSTNQHPDRPIEEMDDDIIRLRRLGYVNEDICRVLDIPLGTYNRWVTRLINEGRTVEKAQAPRRQPLPPEPVRVSELDMTRDEIDNVVVQMRNEGKTSGEIASALNSTIRYDVKNMSRDKIDDIVIRMRNEGKTSGEIASTLKSTIGAIDVRCSRLLNEGRIERRGSGGSQHHKGIPKQQLPLKDNDEIILQMRKDGFTMVQIGEKFGMTKNQVGYRCTKLADAGKLERKVYGKYKTKGKAKAKKYKKKGRRRKVEIDEDVVIRMRRDGFRNWEIEAELEVPTGELDKCITRLIREGKVDKREWKRKGKESEREENTDEIIDDNDEDEDYLQW